MTRLRRDLVVAALAAAAAALLLGACSKDEAAPAAPVVVEGGSDGATAAPPVLDERGLLEAVASGIARRDLEALQATAAPELAADLRRLHDEDAERFWRRGGRWVDDVKSGFDITHRQDEVGGRWNVLIRFGNGHEERVSFSRVDGRLLLDQL